LEKECFQKVSNTHTSCGVRLDSMESTLRGVKPDSMEMIPARSLRGVKPDPVESAVESDRGVKPDPVESAVESDRGVKIDPVEKKKFLC
jgi:hypothetical protein